MLRPHRKDVLTIFILLAFVFAYFYQASGWNGSSRFGLIFAIIEEGRLTIDTYHNLQGTWTGDAAYFNGHYYSDKAIGPSVAGAIFYVPLYWMQQIFDYPPQAKVRKILTFLIVGLPAAIAGSLMYILCLYLSGSRFRAYWVTLAITLGTMYLPYSVSFFSHQFSAALLFSVFFMIFLLKEKPEIRGNGYLFLIGLLAGWALISEYPTAAIILPLMIYYLAIVWRNHNYRHWNSVIMPISGGMIPVLLQLLYNKLCFGNFLSIGYANLNDPVFVSGMAQGVMGFHWPDGWALYYMTLHPTMGLFWESPVLLLSFAGVGFMMLERRYRDEALLALWVIGSYLVMMSGYYMWWGGYALGARHIIPVLPFFCVYLAFVARRFNWLLVGLSLISIGQMLIAAASTVLVPDETLVFRISTGTSNIYSYCLQRLMEGKFAQNLGHQFLGLESWSSLIPLLVVVAGITLFFFWDDINPYPMNQKVSVD